MIDLILLSIAAIVLIIGSIHDIRVREVPDWLNFSLIAAALGIRLLYSSYTSEWSVFINGLVGFVAFYLLALAMFYTGQWGGGDSKLLMGMGAVFGLDIFFFRTFEVPVMVWFFVNSLFVGAIYGFVFSIIMAIRRWKEFKEEYAKRYRRARYVKLGVYAIIIILGILMLVFSGPLYRMMFLILMITLFVILYLWIFIKTVETVGMVKTLKTKELTEGDWIVDEIFIDKKKILSKRVITASDLKKIMKYDDFIPVKVKRGMFTKDFDKKRLRKGDELLGDLYTGRYICGPRDLGIERAQMKQLIELKIKTVDVKEGIPFVPSFFVAFLITVFYSDWMLLLFS